MCDIKLNVKMCKRAGLMTFILPLLPYMAHFSILDSGIYYSITIGLFMYIFFVNFPILVAMLHSKPVYYEDLEDTKYTDHHSRKQHQAIFIFTNQILITIVTSLIVYYYHYKYDNGRWTKLEIVALLGGIKAMMFSTYNFAAKIVKAIIAQRKKTNSRPITLGNSKIHRLSFSLSDMGTTSPSSEKKTNVRSISVITI